MRPGTDPGADAGRSLAEWAAALERVLGGGHVQDVRIAGPELLALAVRRPGASEIVGLSVLATAPGVLSLAELPPQPRSDSHLTAMRDLLRARAVGARVESVSSTASSQPALRFDLRRRDELTSVVLDLGGRGNLEVHGDGHAPQALRPPAGELPDALPAPAMPDAAAMSEAAARARLALETARLESLRERLLHERALQELRQRLRRACKGAVALVVRREADMARLGDPSELRAEADALAAHLHLVRRGQSSLEIPDWNGRPLRIALDPGAPASDALKRGYARAAKAERGVTEAGRRLEEARVRARALEALEARAAAPGEMTRESLAELAAEAAQLLRPDRSEGEARLPPRSRRDGGSGPRDPSLTPREYLSKDGLRILVGRSARGNQALTFRIARGNDAWLHARGCRGPHVVLMLPKGAEIPQESLLDAATLAHARSKLGKEPTGEVAWCRAKDVHARRGMKPGEVTMTREKVISLRLEPARLARLEATET